MMMMNNGSSWNDDGNTEEVNWLGPIFFSFAAILIGVLATMAGVYLALRHTPKGYIIFSFIGSAAVVFTLAIPAFIYQEWSIAIPWFLVGVMILVLLGVLWYRGRLAFAEILLTTQAYLLNRFPIVLAPAFLALVPQILLSLFCITVLNTTLFWGWPAVIFSFFFFYWTSTIITSLVHMTASGTFASWYFSNMETNLDPHQATMAAFKRAITTSFGSVCVSAAILAVVKTLKALSRNRLERVTGSVVLAILDYLNRYALTYCAIYGATLYQAASQINHMFTHHGFKAIMQDNITFTVTTMSMAMSGFVGLLCGGVSALLLAPGVSEDDDSVFFWSMLIIGFFVGMILMQCLVQIIDAGLVTLFVCFVEHPQQLSSLDPSLYHHFRSTYASTCPTLFLIPLEQI